MGQARLSHLLILHYHTEKPEQLELKVILNEYVDKIEARKSTFAKF